MPWGPKDALAEALQRQGCFVAGLNWLGEQGVPAGEGRSGEVEEAAASKASCGSWPLSTGRWDGGVSVGLGGCTWKPTGQGNGSYRPGATSHAWEMHEGLQVALSCKCGATACLAPGYGKGCGTEVEAVAVERRGEGRGTVEHGEVSAGAGAWLQGCQLRAAAAAAAPGLGRRVRVCSVEAWRVGQGRQ